MTFDEHRLHLTDILGACPAAPASPRPASARPGTSAPRASSDPLAQLDPPTYFRLLAGVTPDRRHKVHCPLPDHEDPDPSCHVYPTVEQGWKCYGCGRGRRGAYGIYELAALRADEPTPWTTGRSGESATRC